MRCSKGQIIDFENGAIWQDMKDIIQLLELQLLSALKNPEATRNDDMINKGCAWALDEFKKMPDYLREEIDLDNFIRKESRDERKAK